VRKKMGLKYRYVIKDGDGRTVAVMDEIENVLILLEALNNKYFAEVKLTYTVERTTLEEGD
jgi:hypothetical protein